MIGQKALDRLRVRRRHQRFRRGEHPGTRTAVVEDCRCGECFAQKLAFRQPIGAIRGPAEACNAFAVGFDQRHVDAVERGPAHQADGTQRPHWAFLG